jgi:hypothetical protein
MYSRRRFRHSSRWEDFAQESFQALGLSLRRAGRPSAGTLIRLELDRSGWDRQARRRACCNRALRRKNSGQIRENVFCAYVKSDNQMLSRHELPVNINPRDFPGRPPPAQPLGQGKPGPGVGTGGGLLQFDGRALLFQLLLELGGVFLGEILLDGLGGGLDQVLGFLQAQTGGGTDDLDGGNLLVRRNGLENDVERGLLFRSGRGSRRLPPPPAATIDAAGGGLNAVGFLQIIRPPRRPASGSAPTACRPVP